MTSGGGQRSEAMSTRPTHQRSANGASPPEVYLPILINRAAIATLSYASMEMERHGLTVPKLRTLHFLSAHGPLRVGELLARTSLEAPTMSRILNELQSARLVRRKKMTDDSRSFEIALTPAGTKLMAELTPFLAEVEKLQLEGIDRQDADRLRALLATVFENMTRARNESKEKGRKYARSRL